MYHLIVNHTLPIDRSSRMEFSDCITIENVGNVVQTSREFPFLNVFFQPILLVLKLLWHKCGALTKKILGETPVEFEIDIPSVSLLTRITKVDFSTTNGGIRDIKFDEETLTFCLQMLLLKSNAEVIIRNLVANEEELFKNGTATNLDFTEFVDFICGVVDGDKDVKILREKKFS
ncbi:hypothetical protein LXL04_028120 [Taraxacum kok-saghyz]